MLLETALPPGRSPVIQLYGRASGLAVGSPVAGSALPGRSVRYVFDFGALAPGDYTADISDPAGSFVMRVTEDAILAAEHWWELQMFTDTDPGEGARAITIRILGAGSIPLAGMNVRATQGGVTRFQVTNALGEAYFSLDDGSWEISATGIGYAITPATITVDSNETFIYTATLGAGFVAPAPGLRLGYWKVIDASGEPLEGASVVIRPVEAQAASAGFAVVEEERTETTDADGMVYFTNLVPGMKYEAKLNDGDWFDVLVPISQTTKPLPLGTLLGTTNGA